MSDECLVHGVRWVVEFVERRGKDSRESRVGSRKIVMSESAGENWHGGGGESPLRSKA